MIKKNIKLIVVTIVLILLLIPSYFAITVIIKQEWSLQEQSQINENRLTYITQEIVNIQESIILESLKKDKALELNYDNLYIQYTNNLIKLNTELIVLENKVNEK